MHLDKTDIVNELKGLHYIIALAHLWLAVMCVILYKLGCTMTKQSLLLCKLTDQTIFVVAQAMVEMQDKIMYAFYAVIKTHWPVFLKAEQL